MVQRCAPVAAAIVGRLGPNSVPKDGLAKCETAGPLGQERDLCQRPLAGHSDVAGWRPALRRTSLRCPTSSWTVPRRERRPVVSAPITDLSYSSARCSGDGCRHCSGPCRACCVPARQGRRPPLVTLIRAPAGALRRHVHTAGEAGFFCSVRPASLLPRASRPRGARDSLCI